MQITARAREHEIVQIGESALALWDYMLDVKSGSLQALVHQTILAPPGSARPNCARQFFRDAHYGCLPRICNASPRTSESCSLNSTNASNSSLSDSCRSPSLLRS